MNLIAKRFLLLLFGLMLGLAQGTSVALADTGAVQRDHIEAELIAETTGVQPGTPLRVGLRLLPDQGWHTYWKNPGDSGIPTEIEWDLPPGVTASPIAWPYPGAMPMGHLINYGYKGEHLLPVTLELPQDLAVGDDFVIRAKASWLVCEEICIPGDAELELSLPIASEPPRLDPASQELFAWADQRRPEPVDWPARFSTEGGQLSLQIEAEGTDRETEWAFFSALANVVDHSVPASTTTGSGRILVAQKLSPFLASSPDALPFILVDTVDERAFELTARIGDLTSTGEVAPSAPPIGWLAALGLALIGGLLLNLMPCVFPVLSIKAISLVDGAGSDQRGHGLAYTAGVVLSFALLAAILLALRSAGEAIGWGFQLQSPWIVGLLIYVLFALGLSLSGLFNLGGGFMNAGQNLTERSGLSGSFFTGVLACIVASPCTAPFMGAALGAAVMMPWPMAMSIFVVLGFGLALPLLFLSFSPALARWLPRPGPWMDTFKQAMAFPLYLAVVWLIWVLARQTDANGLAAVLIGLVALAFSLWLFGKRDSGPVMSVARHVSVFAGIVVAIAALAAAARFESGPTEVADAWWEDYSAGRLAELRADPDKAVFVNMTADWCLTCKVNEGVALNKSEVREAFEAESVVYMKGDWTRRDAAITDYLAQFGRNGVPLYVVYPRNGGEPQILPQILTPGLVVSAVEAL